MMTFKDIFDEKEKEISALQKEINLKLKEIKIAAQEAYRSEGLEAFEYTAPCGIDQVQYGGIASITLDPDGNTGHYLFIPELESRHNGWVSSSYMD
jgi:hypothetical protein